MKPGPFTYHRPATLDAALDLLDTYGDAAQILAGGQSLGPLLNLRMAFPEHLIDINDLPDLDHMHAKADRFEIGGLARHHDVAMSREVRRHLPLLAKAVGTIGHYAIRQRGTMGGSIVQADPASQIPLVALTLDADVSIMSGKGARSVPASDFLLAAMEVALEEGEIVTALTFPLQPPARRWAFGNFCRRRGDYALASVAITFNLLEDGTVRDLHCCVGGTSPVPQRLSDIEDASTGMRATADWQAKTARQIAAAISAEDDPHGSAIFRREIVETLVRRALADALAEQVDA